MFVVAVPFRLLHLWLPEIFGISYTIYSLIHWGYTGAEPVYYVLDYDNSPGLSAFYLLLVAFVASPLFHFITFCIYWLRLIAYHHFLQQDKCEQTHKSLRDVRKEVKGTEEESEQLSLEAIA